MTLRTVRGAANAVRSAVAAIASVAIAAAALAAPVDSDRAADPPVSVVGRTDTERVSIGTPFRYTVEVRAPKDAEVLIPVLGGQIGDFFVVDFGDEPPREVADEMVISRWYTLVAYEPGFLFIPGLPVQYRMTSGGELQRVDGEDVGIRLLSLVDGEPDASDIRDIKGPVAVPFDWTPVGVGIAILAGIVALGFVAARLLRSTSPQPASRPSRPPDEIALEALARLRHRRLTEPADRAQWYVDLSAIVRTYIEGRFGLRAPEMTTEEFIYAVQRDSSLGPDHRQLLGQFLTECDLVKFARLVPELDAVERAYGAARGFVTETRPGERVTEEQGRAA